MSMLKNLPHQLSKRLKMVAPFLYRNAGVKPISNGCVISSLGVFPGNYGGGIGFRLGMGQMIPPLSRKLRKPPSPRPPPTMEKLLNYGKMKMFWIHGFHLDYGRFPHLAGQKVMLR